MYAFVFSLINKRLSILLVLYIYYFSAVAVIVLNHIWYQSGCLAYAQIYAKRRSDGGNQKQKWYSNVELPHVKQEQLHSVVDENAGFHVSTRNLRGG